MEDEHPTYPSPTIQEAIIEVHFALREDAEWEPSLFGELYRRLQPDFPVFEPAPVRALRMVAVGGTVTEAVLRTQQRIRYLHESGNLLLQLAQGVATVNVTPEYPGWRIVRGDTQEAWSRVRETVEPAYVTRIGLRYINRIERTRPGETPGDWLKPNDYVPTALLSSLPDFFSRVETRTDPENRLIVTLGEARQRSDEDAGAIVLDIDCITEKHIGIEDEVILAEADRLHEVAWQVFAVSKGPRLERLLQEECS